MDDTKDGIDKINKTDLNDISVKVKFVANITIIFGALTLSMAILSSFISSRKLANNLGVDGLWVHIYSSFSLHLSAFFLLVVFFTSLFPIGYSAYYASQKAPLCKKGEGCWFYWCLIALSDIAILAFNAYMINGIFNTLDKEVTPIALIATFLLFFFIYIAFIIFVFTYIKNKQGYEYVAMFFLGVFGGQTSGIIIYFLLMLENTSILNSNNYYIDYIWLTLTSLVVPIVGAIIGYRFMTNKKINEFIFMFFLVIVVLFAALSRIVSDVELRSFGSLITLQKNTTKLKVGKSSYTYCTRGHSLYKWSDNDKSNFFSCTGVYTKINGNKKISNVAHIFGEIISNDENRRTSLLSEVKSNKDNNGFLKYAYQCVLAKPLTSTQTGGPMNIHMNVHLVCVKQWLWSGTPPQN